MHTNAREKRQCLWQSGGWSEHISTHDSMLGLFVSRQEGIRVGKKGLRQQGGVCSWDVCVCVCVPLVRWVCFICVCELVCVNHNSFLATLHIITWIGHKRQKKLHICACMSRITCSIEYAPTTLPIICLSLSVLFNLFLVSAQWLPLTVSPSQMYPFSSSIF